MGKCSARPVNILSTIIRFTVGCAVRWVIKHTECLIINSTSFRWFTTRWTQSVEGFRDIQRIFWYSFPRHLGVCSSIQSNATAPSLRFFFHLFQFLATHGFNSSFSVALDNEDVIIKTLNKTIQHWKNFFGQDVIYCRKISTSVAKTIHIYPSNSVTSRVDGLGSVLSRFLFFFGDQTRFFPQKRKGSLAWFKRSEKQNLYSNTRYSIFLERSRRFLIQVQDEYQCCPCSWETIYTSVFPSFVHFNTTRVNGKCLQCDQNGLLMLCRGRMLLADQSIYSMEQLSLAINLTLSDLFSFSHMDHNV